MIGARKVMASLLKPRSKYDRPRTLQYRPFNRFNDSEPISSR